MWHASRCLYSLSIVAVVFQHNFITADSSTRDILSFFPRVLLHSASWVQNNLHIPTSPAFIPFPTLSSIFSPSPAHTLPLGTAPLMGIKNLGDTCYMNAVLQSLYHSPYRDSVLGSTFAPGTTGESLHTLFRAMGLAAYSARVAIDGPGAVRERVNVPGDSDGDSDDGRSRVLDPSCLVRAMGLEVGWQQDAHEFLLQLLQQVDESVVSPQDDQRQVSVLPSATVKGTIRQTIECVHEPCTREQTSPFAAIGVDLQPLQSRAEGISALSANGDGGAGDENGGEDTGTCHWGEPGDLHSLLRHSLVQPRPVTVGHHSAAIKYDCITTPLPRALYLHLHRFTYDTTSRQQRKINSPVDFPLLLDLKPYVSPDNASDARYFLSSVIVHLGEGAERGHYITLLPRNYSFSVSSSVNDSDCGSSLEGAEWMVLDDHRRPLTVSGRDVAAVAVEGGGAYLLGYSKL